MIVPESSRWNAVLPVHSAYRVLSALILCLLSTVAAYAQPTALAISSLAPAGPSSGQSLAITVESRAADVTPAAVTQATVIGVSWDFSEPFLVAGSTQATLQAGSSSTTITLTVYSRSASTVNAQLTVAAVGGALSSTTASLPVAVNCAGYARNLDGDRRLLLLGIGCRHGHCSARAKRLGRR